MAANLTTVTIETRTGSKYEFPDMPRDMLENITRKSGWTERLVLVNVSGAVLAMEARIVSTLSYDGEVRWRCPA